MSVISCPLPYTNANEFHSFTKRRRILSESWQCSDSRALFGKGMIAVILSTHRLATISASCPLSSSSAAVRYQATPERKSFKAASRASPDNSFGAG